MSISTPQYLQQSLLHVSLIAEILLHFGWRVQSCSINLLQFPNSMYAALDFENSTFANSRSILALSSIKNIVMLLPLCARSWQFHTGALAICNIRHLLILGRLVLNDLPLRRSPCFMFVAALIGMRRRKRRTTTTSPKS